MKSSLGRLNEDELEVPIVGSVFTGLGHGEYFMSRKGYKKQFEKKLGWLPYPGTLNLRLKEKQINKIMQLSEKKPLEISAFEEDGKNFGAARLYDVHIAGIVNAALIVPVRTSWGKDTVEIISDVFLRGELKLREDQELTFKFITKRATKEAAPVQQN